MKCLIIMMMLVVASLTMENVLYIHGAWHGKWAYDEIKPLLHHNNLFIDYPSEMKSRGISFPTLHDYVQWNVEAINSIFGNDSEVSIVAHSAGGIPAALTVDTLGNRVKKLILISSFILPNMTSLVQIGSLDTESILYENIELNIDPMSGYPDGTFRVNPLYTQSIFYGKCSMPDKLYALSRINQREVFPVMEPVFYKSQALYSVKKYYILNRHDRAISFSYQHQMLDTSPIGIFEKYTLSTDHSPFLSKKQPLSRLLNLIISSA